MIAPAVVADPVSAAVPPPADVLVTVAQGRQIFHEGTRYEPGETLSVSPPVAAIWLRDGHIEAEVLTSQNRE